jgi:uncharacterized membrane protein YphA (DoxX/SURF4 family)
MSGEHVTDDFTRFSLICIFLEDGISMWVEWTEQREYMDISWGCGWFLATMFVVVNLLGQLGGVAMVLFRFRVDIACCVLGFIVFFQTVANSFLWPAHFLFRHLGLIGALLLVLAEARTLSPGVPSLGKNKPEDCLQLTGRILLVLMFVNLLKWSSDSHLQTLQNLNVSALIILVTIGYKTKRAALMLAALLIFWNFNYVNASWNVPDIPANKAMRGVLKWEIFHNLSAIGGLLMVVSLGPGRISMDEHKK